MKRILTLYRFGIVTVIDLITDQSVDVANLKLLVPIRTSVRM
jgi:hypothetical protein